MVTNAKNAENIYEKSKDLFSHFEKEKLNPFVAGQYSNETKEIIFTIAHEVYHLFQYYMVEHTDWESEIAETMYFEEIKGWQDYIGNYCNAVKNGLEEYEQQPLEMSAREFVE